MVKAYGIAACVLIVWVPACGSNNQAAPPSRSLLGRKISKADQIRVQATRLNRLEERIQKLSEEGAFLTERTLQHREMRFKGRQDLRDKIEELNSKLQNQRDDTQKNFEVKLVAVREEMWAQAARDRDALETEMGMKQEAERKRIMEEANQRAGDIVEEMRAKIAAGAERDRELYAQRAALAEEGQELAREERKRVQAEKEELERQLQETIEMEDRFRKKIILKFKARENTLRQNFEAQLQEARAKTMGGTAGRRPRSTKADTSSASSSSSTLEGSQRAAMKSSTPGAFSSGAVGGLSASGSVAATPQR